MRVEMPSMEVHKLVSEQLKEMRKNKGIKIYNSKEEVYKTWRSFKEACEELRTATSSELQKAAQINQDECWAEYCQAADYLEELKLG